MIKHLILAAACALLAACAGNPGGELGSTGAVKVLPADQLPPPTAGDSLTQSREYRIGAFDRLTIDVFGMPELTGREVQADSGGRISFPLAGVVEAGGLTPRELEGQLETRLRAAFVRNPNVTVNLKEASSQLVTVDGQVKQPGVYPVLGGTTLLRAVATARGLEEFAKLDDVVVFRTVAGQRYAALYNLGAIRRGNYPEPAIYANDIVIVGDSKGRRLFKDLLQIVPLLTTPLIIAIQNKAVRPAAQ